jgi:hypothetical protein
MIVYLMRNLAVIVLILLKLGELIQISNNKF